MFCCALYKSGKKDCPHLGPYASIQQGNQCFQERSVRKQRMILMRQINWSQHCFAVCTSHLWVNVGGREAQVIDGLEANARVIGTKSLELQWVGDNRNVGKSMENLDIFFLSFKWLAHYVERCHQKNTTRCIENQKRQQENRVSCEAPARRTFLFRLAAGEA